MRFLGSRIRRLIVGTLVFALGVATGVALTWKMVLGASHSSALAWSMLAWQHYEAGRYAPAIDAACQAAARDPEEARRSGVLIVQGLAFARSENYEAAARAFRLFLKDTESDERPGTRHDRKGVKRELRQIAMRTKEAHNGGQGR